MERVVFSRKVVVIGESAEADHAAREIAELGLEPVRVFSEPSQPSALPLMAADTGRNISYHATVAGLEGQPGSYRLMLRSGASSFDLDVGAVIIATGCATVAPFNEWGLAPGEDVFSLSSLESKGDSYFKEGRDGKLPACTLFVCGFRATSHPVLLERTLLQAIRMREIGVGGVFVATDHLKVASRGLERLLGRARDTGVIFLRSVSSMPRILRDGQELEARCLDEALGEFVTLRPDLVVLEDILAPWRGTDELSKALGLGLDRAGFFQGDCIHEQPIFTNRTGVFVIGSAKGVVSKEKALEEAAAAAAEVAGILLESGRGNVQKIELDKKKCTICLTCYRVCPHRAITYLKRRPVFFPLACKGCGICMAECPMDAIQLKDSQDLEIKARIRDAAAGAAPSKTKQGPLIVFSCRRSGIEAAERGLPDQRSFSSTVRLIEVPCAGRIDPDHLFTAFRYGAAGVLVMACHHGSCRSFEGSLFAEGRSTFVKETLKDMGVPEGRLSFSTIAPMEYGAFFTIVQSFEKTVRQALSEEMVFPGGVGHEG